jgi:hypothetical protein
LAFYFESFCETRSFIYKKIFSSQLEEQVGRQALGGGGWGEGDLGGEVGGGGGGKGNSLAVITGLRNGQTGGGGDLRDIYIT